MAQSAQVADVAQTPAPTPTATPTPGPDQSLTLPIAGDNNQGRTDLPDLIRSWRDKPLRPPTEHPKLAWTIVPIISSKPSTGFKAGAGADAEFNLGQAGTTRFSSITTSFAYSTNNQLSAGENFRLYGQENRWIIEGQNHYSGSSSNNVEFGTSSTTGSEPKVKYYSLQFIDTYYYRLTRHIYAGGGLYFIRQTDIAPSPENSPEWDTSPFRTYSDEHGFSDSVQTAAGPGFAIRFDSRDSQNDATQGYYALASFRTFIQGFLGGDSTWSELYTDVRTYRNLTSDKRHRLAFWGLGTFVTSGSPPYLSHPTNGGDEIGRSARGYPEGRFRGNDLLYGEAEYRALLTRNGFLGFALFLNATTVNNPTTGERLFDSVAVAGGGGLRFLIHKHSRTNFCVDYALGQNGSHGLYISLRDAF